MGQSGNYENGVENKSENAVRLIPARQWRICFTKGVPADYETDNLLIIGLASQELINIGFALKAYS